MSPAVSVGLLMLSSVVTLLQYGHACSNFMMENDYRISARTMDLGSFPGDLQFAIVTIPIGSDLRGPISTSRFGSVSFSPVDLGIEVDYISFGGLNTAGLTCDSQTLLHTKYPPKTNTSSDIPASHFCAWALGIGDSVSEIQQFLLNGTITLHADLIFNNQCPIHWVLRDASGNSIVIEFDEAAKLSVISDPNDGRIGFGIMTNEPSYGWHVENVKHYQWKQHLARPSTAMPGSFYPDERYLRIHLIKSSMPDPKSYKEAMMQAVHTLNSITVPMGSQIGTDSGPGEGEGDHTIYGVIYDHANSTLYFRTEVNQNLQRLRLSDLKLTKENPSVRLLLDNTQLSWFDDASHKMHLKR